MNGLRDELARVGIRGRLADRIVAELDDHLACDPGANVGSPALIAERFAAELRLPETRRATHLVFAGLALAALLLVAVQPGQFRDLGGAASLTVAFSGLAIALGAQVAFVAGMLALWGAHRRTGLDVVQRRALIAVAGGAVVLAGELVDAAVMKDWVALVTLAPVPLLVAALDRVRMAAAMTPVASVEARGFSGREASAVGAAVVVAMIAGSAFAEHSWGEGVSRGILEAVAFATGYLTLGRRLGIRR